MFSGIIEQMGCVTQREELGNALRLTLATSTKDLSLGESLAVDGVCLTVETADREGKATFYVSPETLVCTALQRLQPGSRVNLERATMLSTRLSGHIVQGHVDGLGSVRDVQRIGDAHKIGITLPNAWRRYIVAKGSIALNGVSLTVNEIVDINAQEFALYVLLIPHSWQHTNLSDFSVGDALNVELDVIAKYVENLVKYGDLR